MLAERRIGFAQWRNSNGCLSATMVLRAPLRRIDAVSTALEDEYSHRSVYGIML
ncbi:hypothetical protein BIFBRE_03231 [Bifidobacterium breve DSM 20213 = JCM 1192]|uniref:Uncharacterized protein n=1 Tax=Bifidobacterium breve DSM 20213 = JCM 1192 TaxID=518634 RepID=D4BMD7_BIFBR|nr:hypothetical protein BIFBRE_03231 [Bifidobacterium breve DSM 20213 = JCM 1192]